MHVPEVLLLVTQNRDDHGSQFHGHALCYSTTQIHAHITYSLSSRSGGRFTAPELRSGMIHCAWIKVQMLIMLDRIMDYCMVISKGHI